jgi:hypothetical protein
LLDDVDELVGDEPLAPVEPDELLVVDSLLDDVEPLPELSELPPLLLPPLSDDDELDAAAVRDDDPRLSVL